MKSWFSFLTALVGFALFGAPGFAASVLPVGLDKLQSGAETIFYGECLSQQSDMDPSLRLPVTYANFRVLESLKGQPGEIVTIKQLGGTLANGGQELVVPGVPKFEPGKQYILFLPRRSELGFASPVALDQGRFSIREDERGSRQVGNGRDFKELVADLPANRIPARVNDRLKPAADGANAQKPKPELPLDDFLSLLRSIR